MMGNGRGIKQGKIMKKYIAILLGVLLAAGCDDSEQSAESMVPPVFTAYFESQPTTKVYVDSELQMCWTEGDRISIFTDSHNKPYTFTGKTGDTKATFADDLQIIAETPFSISTNYAVYPYDASTAMTQDEKIKLNIPAVQSYESNTFGIRSNPMVAVTSGPSDHTLCFRNLCGYLVVRLYGSGTVKSVSLTGNNNEKLAGPALVTASHDAAPTLELDETAATTISIDCQDGIALGADEKHAIDFWFCIPPTTFSKGFTVTVVNTDDVKVNLSISSSKTIARNHKASMNPKNIHHVKSMPPATQGYADVAPESRKYRNYLLELGIPQYEIDAKINTIYNTIFGNKDGGAYHEVEVKGQKMAYISDVKNKDVRSEGMSYGMMIAVQMNKPDMFDRLWRWANYYMRHNDITDASYGLFAWQCRTNGSRMSQGSASDGELYFVTALLLASRRWGQSADAGYNYLEEAQTLLNQLFSKDGTGGVTNIINTTYNLINFCPDTNSNKHTDPSYHLPAFYEIWAETAQDERETIYHTLAANARDFLHKATNAKTGLNPDQCNFDGTLMQSYWGGSNNEFHYDSWRVPMNIAMDFTWYHKDAEWQSDYASRMVKTVVGEYGLTTFPDQFALDGGKPKYVMGGGSSSPKLRHSIGFVGAMATTSLMIDDENYSQDLVRHMFDQKLEPYSDGYYDVYYDGLIYLFALLHLSGNYRMNW